MKNKSWFYYIVLTVLVILMILVANFRFKSMLPSGNIDIQLVPVIAVTILGSFELTTALLAAIAATVVLLILHWLSWPDLLILILDWLAVTWMIRRHPQKTAPQSRLISITMGLSQVVSMTVIYLIIAWAYTRQLTGVWSFLGQFFPVAILSGLLYALLTAPAISFVRWLLKISGDDSNHQLPADKDNGSVEIDLSSHNSDKNDDKQDKG